MVSKRIITRDCLKIYESEKENVLSLLGKIESQVSFANDIWTSS